MSVSKQVPKYRRPLNDKQLLILRVLYKFRFITVELMTKSGRRYDRDVIRSRLRILMEQNYIGRRYDNSYIKNNNYGIYYLLPDGIRALAKQPGLNHSVLHAVYNDRRVGEEFINHCLNIFELYRKFEKLYPDKYKMLTKSETAGHDYYPKLLPDIHLQNKQGNGDYFLELVDDSITPYIIRRKLNGYAEHYDSGDWEDKTDGDYPTILLVCSTPKIERGLQLRIPSLINADDLTVYTTSSKALMESSSSDDEIWTNMEEPEVLVNLNH